MMNGLVETAQTLPHPGEYDSDRRSFVVNTTAFSLKTDEQALFLPKRALKFRRY